MGRFRFALTTSAAICATVVVTGQQPPAAAPSAAAQERQAAEINARRDSPGSGRFAAIEDGATFVCAVK
jgi:hypothetical protein